MKFIPENPNELPDRYGLNARLRASEAAAICCAVVVVFSIVAGVIPAGASDLTSGAFIAGIVERNVDIIDGVMVRDVIMGVMVRGVIIGVIIRLDIIGIILLGAIRCARA